MRAFQSHSSKDKDFVERVAALLKPGTAGGVAETTQIVSDSQMRSIGGR
jgi:hypothetical protein